MKIIERKLIKSNLLKIQKIDKEFYNDDSLNIEWYLRRYNEKQKGIFLLDNEKIVGYLVCVPIKKELYDAIINGVLLNDLHINPKMFVEKSNYNYIVSIVIRKDYQQKGNGSLMMKKLFENAKGKYCALTISDEGYYLAQKFLNLIVRISDKVNVFEKEVS